MKIHSGIRRIFFSMHLQCSIVTPFSVWTQHMRVWWISFNLAICELLFVLWLSCWFNAYSLINLWAKKSVNQFRGQSATATATKDCDWEREATLSIFISRLFRYWSVHLIHRNRPKLQSWNVNYSPISYTYADYKKTLWKFNAPN